MVLWTGGIPSSGRPWQNPDRALKFDTLAVLGVVGLLLTVMLAVLREPLGLNLINSGMALGIFFAIGSVVIAKLRFHGHDRFGMANAITAFRAAITACVGGLVLTGSLHPASPDIALWTMAALVAFGVALDGVDGAVARRSGRASRFGARFDMEVDALLILFLSIAAFELGKAGAWVIAIGLLRYGFMVAQVVFPFLQGELPRSRRRQAICVVQGVALCIAVLPIAESGITAWILLSSLIALAASFLRDVAYLFQVRPGIATVAGVNANA